MIIVVVIVVIIFIVVNVIVLTLVIIFIVGDSQGRRQSRMRREDIKSIEEQIFLAKKKGKKSRQGNRIKTTPMDEIFFTRRELEPLIFAVLISQSVIQL